MLYWINGQYGYGNSLNKIQQSDRVVYFESFRTYKGKVVLFREHYHLICSILNEMRLGFPYSLTDLYKVIVELTKKADGEDGIFYLTVFTKHGERQWVSQEVNVLIIRTAIHSRKRGTEKAAQWLQTDKPSLEQQISSLLKTPLNAHYVAESIACNSDEMEGFYLTAKGYIADSLNSNIFWVKDDILYTPSLVIGIAPRVTRNWLVVMAEKLNYLVIDDFFIKSELEEAYECFITNSINEIIPISNIGDVHFLGEEGPIYQLFHQAYIEEIIQTLKRSKL